jgi:TolB-like protein/Tfp pilus assembly protein PilF
MNPPAAEKSLRVFLLGPLRITIDDTRIADRQWTRRKPKQLVKLLALQPHHQLHREQLMDLMWPDLDPEAAANNLHKTIHLARHALQPELKSGADSDFILTQGPQVILSAPGELWIDAEEFAKRASEAIKTGEIEAGEAALDLYQADLLPEDLYEEWTSALRERLRTVFHELLARLAESHETRGEFALAIERLKQLTVVDSANEEAHRQLMLLYTRTGKQQQALRQFEQCRNALRRELDTPPDPATIELHRKIVSGQLSATTPKPSRQVKVQSATAITSLAILPLLNQSADPNAEYLSDGVTESIIKNLSQLRGLRVMSWGSVIRYKGSEVDPREAGRELAVRAILRGKVLQFGDRLIIRTELVDTQDGAQLWGEQYDRKFVDVLMIQEDIASRISETLQLKLSGEEHVLLTRRQTENPEAYQAYLRGLYFWNKRTEGGLMHAIEHFAQAAKADPGYALAHGMLASSYALLSWYSVMAPRDSFPKAKAAASRALELDDSLAEAYMASAWIKFSFDWNFPGAEEDLRTAIRLNPQLATAHQWYALFLSAMDRHSEATEEIERARSLDPLSLVINRDVGWALYWARRYDRAVEAYKRTIELAPNFYIAHYFFGETYEQMGRFSEAVNEFRETKSHTKEATLVWTVLAQARANALSGKMKEAREYVNELEKLANEHYVSPYLIAVVHTSFGDKEATLQWLEKAYRDRDCYLVYLNVEPALDSLRTNQRFADLVQRVVPLRAIKSSSRSEMTSSQRNRDVTALAIMPLMNVSEEADVEYLSDGITEAIINSLSQLPQLKVIARSTVFRYKDTPVDPQQVGIALGVDAILTGRIFHRGEILNIQTELVDVRDGTQLWGEQYNRSANDILELQEELAREITGKLRLRLSSADMKKLAKRHTENREAYELYLRGRYFWNKRSLESVMRSIEYFQQAIALDPDYALAYVGIADSYTKLGDVGVAALPPKEAFSKAKIAAVRALGTDVGLAEAHTSLAHLYLHEYEWEEAEREFKYAIELNPNYGTAHHWYAYCLAMSGRRNEWRAEIEKARELDPLSLPINADYGELLYFAGLDDEALEQLRKALELDSDFYQAHITLGRIHERNGKPTEAMAEFQYSRDLSGDNLEALVAIGRLYAVSGENEKALEVLSNLKELSQFKYVSPYGVAVVHAALGDKSEAFEWMKKAAAEHSGWIIYLNLDPWLDSLRTDPRFNELLRSVNLASGPIP